MAREDMHPMAKMALGVAQAIIIALLIGSGSMLVKLDRAVSAMDVQISELPQVAAEQANHETRITHLEDDMHDVQRKQHEDDVELHALSEEVPNGR